MFNIYNVPTVLFIRNDLFISGLVTVFSLWQMLLQEYYIKSSSKDKLIFVLCATSCSVDLSQEIVDPGLDWRTRGGGYWGCRKTKRSQFQRNRSTKKKQPSLCSHCTVKCQFQSLGATGSPLLCLCQAEFLSDKAQKCSIRLTLFSVFAKCSFKLFPQREEMDPLCSDERNWKPLLPS